MVRFSSGIEIKSANRPCSFTPNIDNEPLLFFKYGLIRTFLPRCRLSSIVLYSFVKASSTSGSSSLLASTAIIPIPQVAIVFMPFFALMDSKSSLDSKTCLILTLIPLSTPLKSVSPTVILDKLLKFHFFMF